MRRIDSARVSLAMSGTALFVALGGTAVAVTGVTTSQIRNGAVSTAKLKNGAVSTPKLANGSVRASKLGNGAVTGSKLANAAVGTAKLADNAVTSQKVLDGSLSASDLAPNTFLPAGGTAANSQQLDGLTARGFVQGTGKLVSNRIVVPVGSTVPLLELDFGFIDGTCLAGAIPVQRLHAELSLQEVVYTATNFGTPAVSDIHSANALTGGNFLEATHTSTTPQSVTWQATYNDGTQHAATAWTTGQDEGGSCVFTGQGITTL